MAPPWLPVDFRLRSMSTHWVCWTVGLLRRGHIQRQLLYLVGTCRPKPPEAWFTVRVNSDYLTMEKIHSNNDPYSITFPHLSNHSYATLHLWVSQSLMYSLLP